MSYRSVVPASLTAALKRTFEYMYAPGALPD